MCSFCTSNSPFPRNKAQGWLLKTKSLTYLKSQEEGGVKRNASRRNLNNANVLNTRRGSWRQSSGAGNQDR